MPRTGCPDGGVVGTIAPLEISFCTGRGGVGGGLAYQGQHLLRGFACYGGDRHGGCSVVVEESFRRASLPFVPPSAEFPPQPFPRVKLAPVSRLFVVGRSSSGCACAGGVGKFIRSGFLGSEGGEDRLLFAI